MKDAVGEDMPHVMLAVPDQAGLGGRAAPAGAMTTLVCDTCGHVEWYTSDASELAHPTHVLGKSDGVCPACGPASHTHVRAREKALSPADVVDRAVAIRVTLFGWQPLGHLQLTICGSCGLTGWTATGLDQLSVDPDANVSELDGARAVPRSAGPYR